MNIVYFKPLLFRFFLIRYLNNKTWIYTQQISIVFLNFLELTNSIFHRIFIRSKLNSFNQFDIDSLIVTYLDIWILTSFSIWCCRNIYNLREKFIRKSIKIVCSPRYKQALADLFIGESTFMNFLGSKTTPNN